MSSFIKRNIKNRQMKRKQSSSSSDENEQESAVVKIQQKNKKLNPNVQSTSKSFRKVTSEVLKNNSSNSENEDDVIVSYKSKKTSVLSSAAGDHLATSELQTETEVDRDAQAIFERQQAVNEELKGKSDDKVYRGLNNYASYYKKQDTAQGNASSGMVRKGPIRAPTNIRSTVRWDYQPDICKDYKETGYCGFGDSCKFLHDRTDYKHGWQLEKDEGTGGKFDPNDSDDDDTKYEIHSDEEELPFKCFICRESFTDPIVTKCKHYFCEKCALEEYKKSTRCFICRTQTNGVFNPAMELLARLKSRENEDEK